MTYKPIGDEHRRINIKKEQPIGIDAKLAEARAMCSILEGGRVSDPPSSSLAGAFAGEQPSGPERSPLSSAAAELAVFGGLDDGHATRDPLAPNPPPIGNLEDAMRKAGLVRDRPLGTSVLDIEHPTRSEVLRDKPSDDPPLPGASAELVQKDGKRRSFTDDERRQVLPEWRKWIVGPLKLERVHHSVMEAAANLHIRNHGSFIDKDARKPSPMQSLMVAHDWAAMLGGVEQVGELRDERGAEWRVPYDHQCFEFCITAWRVCAFVAAESNGAASAAMCIVMRGPRSANLDRLWIADDAHYELVGDTCLLLTGYEAIIRGEQEVNAGLDRLAKLVSSQIRACSIFLDAQVAVTEPVRAPHRSNRAAPERVSLPAMSHHMVQLHRRPRTAVLPQSASSEPDETRRRQRWHLRRGHWRHYSEHKTWIRWYAAGDWDLGVIFKDYKL